MRNAVSKKKKVVVQNLTMCYVFKSCCRIITPTTASVVCWLNICQEAFNSLISTEWLEKIRSEIIFAFSK